VRRETDKRKKVIESDQTSLLINEEKNSFFGEIKCKTLLAEKKIYNVFEIKKTQTSQ